MSYCCVCGRDVNHHIKSFHCNIDDTVYHYCHRHSFIGRRVLNKYVVNRVLTKEQVGLWEEIKKEYLG